MKNYHAPADGIQVTAPYAVVPGDGMLIGSLFCIAAKTAALGALTDAVTEGMFYMTTVSGETAAEGAVAYWDATNKRVSTTSGTAIGHFTYGKGSSEVLTRVRLQVGGGVSGAGGVSPKKTGSYVTRMGCGATNTTVTVDYNSVEQKPLDIYPPRAIRLGLYNYGSTVTQVAQAKMALAPTDLNNGTALVWYALKALGLTAFSIPAMTQGAFQSGGQSNNRIPGMLFVDLVPVSPVARTDTPGAPYLLQARFQPAAGTALNVSGGPITRTNSSKPYLADRGYLFGWQQSTIDIVTNPAGTALAPNNATALGLIGSIEVFTGNGTHFNLYAFGDSLTAGYSGTADGGECAYLNVVAYNMRAKGIIGGVSNFAVGGQLQETYIATMKAVIGAGATPSAVILSAFSPNSGASTQAQWDIQLGAIFEAVQWLLTRGIPVYVTDAMPLDSLNATQDGYRKAFNTSLYNTIGAMAGCTVVRFAAAVEDPANSAKINPAYANHANDGVHLGLLGQEVQGAVMSTALGL